MLLLVEKSQLREIYPLINELSIYFRSRSFQYQSGVWRGFAIWSREEQHREESSMAKILRLSLATLTFLVFFYSTTLLTSYFYPLDWAPIAF
jgi:hypothetical protein